MLQPCFALRMFLIATMVLGASVVSSQNFPSKTVHIVVGGVGGANDVAARLIAPVLAGNLGQPVVVDNRGGAGGSILAQTVINAPPDGHTFLLYSGSLWVAPLMQKMPYDPVKDFLPITLLSRAPYVLIVHPSLPAKSVKELIVLAKARPGEINYASGGLGSASHLAGELLKNMAGVNIMRINYKSTTSAITALLAGEVQLTFGSTAAVAPYIKSGRLRALAVSSAQPSALFPGLPAIAATVPGYESMSILATFAAVKTPAAIINRLNQEFVRILNTTEIKEKFLNSGSEVIAGSPEELAVMMKADIARMEKLIKDTGLRLDF